MGKDNTKKKIFALLPVRALSVVNRTCHRKNPWLKCSSSERKENKIKSVQNGESGHVKCIGKNAKQKYDIS